MQVKQKPSPDILNSFSNGLCWASKCNKNKQTKYLHASNHTSPHIVSLAAYPSTQVINSFVSNSSFSLIQPWFTSQCLILSWCILHQSSTHPWTPELYAFHMLDQNICTSAFPVLLLPSEILCLVKLDTFTNSVNHCI